MAKKLLYIKEDPTDKGYEAFAPLCEAHGYELATVDNGPALSMDEFMSYFLKIEKEGPDAVPCNEAVVEAAKDAEIVITAMCPVPSRVLEEGKDLKAVGIIRSGVENVDVARATVAGVQVINCPGRLAVPVSEYTVGLIIAEMKNIARSHKRVMEHNFTDDTFCNTDYTVNLKGRNVGIVGLGAIGSRVAKIMKAFEANVLVYEPFASPEALKAQGYVPMSLNELCQNADVITVHMRLLPETEGILGKEQFALMKPTCVLINTARAGLVDEEAMMDALINHKIGGAGLDVWHHEPLPEDSPLLKLDNVTLTSHLAGWCSDVSDISRGIMVDAVSNYFETGKWINTVNKIG